MKRHQTATAEVGESGNSKMKAEIRVLIQYKNSGCCVEKGRGEKYGPKMRVDVGC